MTRNDQLEGIEAAQLAGVSGGAGVKEWFTKAKEKVTTAVREGIDYVRKHPEVVGTGRPLTLPRR